jgi:hypothetical protein
MTPARAQCFYNLRQPLGRQFNDQCCVLRILRQHTGTPFLIGASILSATMGKLVAAGFETRSSYLGKFLQKRETASILEKTWSNVRMTLTHVE